MGIPPPVFPPADPNLNLNKQLDTMVAGGVENLRVVFDWSYAQPYASWSSVPPGDTGRFTNVGGVPTDFSRTDQIVALAASRRLTVLPAVLYTPSWDATQQGSALPLPAHDQAYSAFLGALVARYGPHGSFWSDHSPEVAIRSWQIWNEPDLAYFWAKQPFAHSYVALLRAAHDAIKRADPGANVVLAGLANRSWSALSTIYRVRGARKLFDVVAVHPFTRVPQGVITILTYVRQVMNRAGDTAKPIVADELGWLSSRGKTSEVPGLDFTTTELGQAKRIREVLAMLGRSRTKLGLAGFDYVSWAGIEDRGGNPFDFAGLFRYDSGKFIRKPAFAAFRRGALTLEHCRQKGTVATTCARPR